MQRVTFGNRIFERLDEMFCLDCQTLLGLLRCLQHRSGVFQYPHDEHTKKYTSINAPFYALEPPLQDYPWLWLFWRYSSAVYSPHPAGPTPPFPPGPPDPAVACFWGPGPPLPLKTVIIIIITRIITKKRRVSNLFAADKYLYKVCWYYACFIHTTLILPEHVFIGCGTPSCFNTPHCQRLLL